MRSSSVRYGPTSPFVASLLVSALTLAGNASAQSFVLKTTEAGLGDLAGLNGVSAADYDIDGDLDLYVANGFLLQPAFENRLFINSLSNTGAVSFSSESNLAGTNGTAEARALVVFDDDGDLDLIVANHQRSPIVNSDDPWPYLYENVNSTLNWIKIDLV